MVVGRPHTTENINKMSMIFKRPLKYGYVKELSMVVEKGNPKIRTSMTSPSMATYRPSRCAVSTCTSPHYGSRRRAPWLTPGKKRDKVSRSREEQGTKVMAGLSQSFDPCTRTKSSYTSVVLTVYRGILNATLADRVRYAYNLYNKYSE